IYSTPPPTILSLFSFITRRQPRSTLFPYTTLFRSNPTAVADAAAAIGEDDLFTFIYTSGTTGPPKACMIRHRNYYAMVDEVRQVDRKSTRLNSSHVAISYAVFCLKKKNERNENLYN